ncbi:MAG: UDP-N-acetylmuramoyl-L-alanyl-D-glutamate--2,6-diaminopimelate ligase [Bacilli bacterium]|nr:UDP-N-acetylmuramoyl-L-alanyl-D-glutamate--2,6-diaminopimelate ligase [Bacilli bacterium]
MKKINEIYDCVYDTEIKDIKINSKEVKEGDIFVCTKGVNADRHDFIDDAVKNGASFLIVKKDGDYKVPYIKVDDPNKELPILAKKFYDYPDDKIKLIGITGTDGKTTTATIIRDLLGYNDCGYIGTNGIEGKSFSDKAANTTPECHLIYKYLSMFLKDGLKYASIETSSEAFYRKRLDSFSFDVGILTNVTGDHLNIHRTFENYIESKKMLFEQLKPSGVAILNIDDKYYDYFKNINRTIMTYGKDKNADLRITNIKEKLNGTNITFTFKNEKYIVESPLLGEFNVYNLMASILCLSCFGIDIKEIISRIKNIKVPKGRCEVLNFDTDYNVVLDYAHTVNGLTSILDYLNKIKQNRIITITGSAGGREREKRKDMGKVVLEKSDLVIFTMDDPRNEDPKDIIDEMIDTNKGNYEIIIDRELAINHALDSAQKGDIILVAGKGRDSYMAIGSQYIPYCDYDVITNYFSKK